MLMNALKRYHLLVNIFASTPLDHSNAHATTDSLFNPTYARANCRIKIAIVHLTESVEAMDLVCALRDGLDQNA